MAKNTTNDAAKLLQPVLVLIEKGQLDAAANDCARVIKRFPSSAAAWVVSGLIQRRRGDNSGAIAAYRRALQLDPASFDAHNNLGNALRDAGQLDEAQTAFEAAIALRPDGAVSRLALADLLRQRGDTLAAEASYRACIAACTDNLSAWYQLAALHEAQGDMAATVKVLDELLAAYPRETRARFLRGQRLERLGRDQEAMTSYQQLIEQDREHWDGYNALGQLLVRVGRFRDGLACFEQAYAVGGRQPQGLKNLGVGLLEVPAELARAIAVLKEYLALVPDDVNIRSALIHAENKTCNWDSLADLRRTVVEPALNWTSGDWPPLPFSFHVLPVEMSEAEHLVIARRYADFIKGRTRPDRYRGQGAAWAPGQRVRIGYLSTDFNNHAVAQLMLGVFKRHDRSRFEVYAYSLGPNDGSVYRQRIEREVDMFVDLRGQRDEVSAARIHGDGIHLLIDLNGYTRGCHPAILAQRPAPVQLQYLGYPGTLGAEFVDYILTDRVLTPPASQPYYPEQFLYLPRCYQANDDEQPIGETPTRADCGLPEDAFVFCCFCNLYKLEPVMFAVWMRLLQQVPGSVLWLSAGAAARDNLRRHAETAGVDPARLIFAERIEDKKDHLARHRCADLFLDTLYYNAHTTASDALWAGLPVLTCPGPVYARRVSASLLQGLGLPELIAADLAGYERRALAYARDPAALAEVREKLAHARIESPVYQTARFVRDLDAVLWEVAQRHLGVALGEPASPERAMALYRAGDHAAAISMVERLLAEHPQADLENFAGVLQRALGRPEAAEAAYRRASALLPGFVDPHINLGNVLHDGGRFEEAETAYRQAVAIAPHSALAHAGLGKSLRDQERLEAATEALERALQLEPNNADAEWDLALTRLALGDYRAGFAGYEARWLRRQPAPPAFSQPAWAGEPLADQTLLIYCEQGIGDAAQYLRFLPRVLARAGRVVVEVPAALLPLVPALPGLQVVERGSALPAFDRHYALMSLPHLFGLGLADVGMAAPYLQVPEARLAHWRARLGPARRPRVGVVWAGNPNHRNDRARSIGLAAMAGLFQRNDVEFYLLQLGPGRADLDGVVLPPNVVDLGPEIDDFADTGAVMSLLDVTITPDTSTAHVAGALGLPVWVLLACPPDWRWLTGREDSPWYPSARLFRQSTRGDWSRVLARVGEALDTLRADWRADPSTEAWVPPAAVELPALSVDDWLARARSAQAAGEGVAAETAYRQALAQAPAHAEAWRELGNLLRAHGRADEALTAYQRSLEADPDAIATLIVLSDLLRERGDAEGAVAAAQRATELAPEVVAGWNNLGAALVVAGRREEAVAAFERGLALDPGHLPCLMNLCWQLERLGRLAECLEQARQGLARHPAERTLHLAEVRALRQLGRADEAHAALVAWLSDDSRDAEACQMLAELCNERSLLAFNQGRHADALAALEEGVRWAPDWPVIHYNLGLLQLHHLDYRNGWAEFEWRLKLPQIGPHALNRPPWQGDDSAGRTILVHWEQGFGDSLQFLRFVPILQQRGARVVLEVQAPLTALCREMPGLAGVYTVGDVYPPGIELKCSLLSLPHRLGIERATLPTQAPYLHAPQQRLARWSERLGPRRRPRIGLVWAGSPTNATEHARAPGLASLRPLWDNPEVEFVIIQKGAGRAALEGVELPANVIDVGEETTDFADTAAVMVQLDAMISSDTSTAHLAGALGIPLWVPLHFTADWRWVEPDGRCLWYPTAKIFRQSAPGRWDDVVAALEDHLAAWLEQHENRDR